MVRRDNLIQGIYNGEYLKDVQFILREFDSKTREIRQVQYEGAYVIVDNGYLRWSVTVPPFKVTNTTAAIRWSKWVESMRKDVECTFGILKGRWRILKAGVGLDGVGAVDDIWRSCCALHNWLLDIDGLSGEWKNGVPLSDWLGELGQHKNEYALNNQNIPNAIKRLTTNLNFRNYDSSGMGPGDDIQDIIHCNLTAQDIDCNSSDDDDDDMDSKSSDNDDDIVTNSDDIITSDVQIVRSLSLKFFRQKLVEHFEIMYNNNQIQWPSHP